MSQASPIFKFKIEGDILTGKAKSAFANAETAITEGVIKAVEISFVENLNYEGMLRLSSPDSSLECIEADCLGDNHILERSVFWTDKEISHPIRRSVRS